MVCAATDDLCGGRVAIKKIKPISGDTWDAKHVLRELRLMRLMAHHPNVISLHDLNIVHENDELYIIMELMDSDLHKIIQSKQKLSRPHCQVSAEGRARDWRGGLAIGEEGSRLERRARSASN